MSPTRTLYLAATPRCQARLVTKKGQHGVHYTCDTPLQYSQTELQWRCPECGATAIRATPPANNQNQNATA